MTPRTLSEAIQDAAQEPNVSRRREKVEGIVAYLRFRLGWTAEQCRQAAVKSGVDAERWEELMYSLDNP